MTKAKQTAKEIVAVQDSIIVRTPEVIATEIRFIDGQTRQYVLNSAIEIGQKLTEAKTLVAHGEWGTWLQNNVNYSQSTANNFMKIASEYTNSQAFESLTYSQAVALLSVPTEERESFVEQNNVTEMSTRELQAAIKEKQELEHRLAEEKLRAEKAEQHAEAAKAAREVVSKSLDEANKEKRELDKQLEDLKSELEVAKSGGNDQEITKLKTELKKTAKAAKDAADKTSKLEDTLKQKEAEIENVIADRLKQREQELATQSRNKEEEYIEQIAKLEQQLQRNNSEAFMKFKVHFGQLTSGFDTLLKSMAEIQDISEKSKLKQALGLAVDKMKEALK